MLEKIILIHKREGGVRETMAEQNAKDVNTDDGENTYLGCV